MLFGQVHVVLRKKTANKRLDAPPLDRLRGPDQHRFHFGVDSIFGHVLDLGYVAVERLVERRTLLLLRFASEAHRSDFGALRERERRVKKDSSMISRVAYPARFLLLRRHSDFVQFRGRMDDCASVTRNTWVYYLIDVD